jgi:hypothetical protein
MLWSQSLAWKKAVTPATVVIVRRRSRRDSGATRFSEEHHHDFDDECWKHHAIINFPDNIRLIDRKRMAFYSHSED